MSLFLPEFFALTPEIIKALRMNTPIVALETTVLTHGLPYPYNIDLVKELESEIRSKRAIPATIGVLNGKIHIGMTEGQIEALLSETGIRKISSRDFAPILAKGESGGTTVAGTLVAAHKANIKVFATGGIGGVHRGAPFDISADLIELSRTPMVVVCAGAKAILDLPATLEYLETTGVVVLGYKTDIFPAFFSKDSGLHVNFRVESAEQVVQIATIHWKMGLSSAILVTVPPPDDIELPAVEVAEMIDQALGEISEKKIRGQAVTPYLLNRVSELTGKASLQANLGLLHSNARIAAEIAVSMNAQQKTLCA